MNTSDDSTAILCAVCANESLLVYEIGGLKRASCSVCHHTQRIDSSNFAYENYAMGGTATSSERLQSQADFIVPHLKTGTRALEIGCAKGDLARVLRASHEFSKYDAIELSPASEIAKTVVDKVFGSPSTQLLKEGLIESAHYDLILASHCLEHLTDLQKEVENIKRLLSPDGLIFIEVPNISGSSVLPFDDNRTHLHFFSVTSLSHLFAMHGFEIQTATTGAWHDARYSDSIRVIAKKYRPQPAAKNTLLSDKLDVDKVIVWGVGKMTAEVLEHFFDPQRIDYFVDRDVQKQGTFCMNRPVRSPLAILEEKSPVVLINSLEFEASIRSHLEEQFKEANVRIISIGKLMASS
jgi:2-polyprenyl-3-methyl-5-hydroxy-6-metoxy-1,4-benzoquinol methylase